MRPEFHLSPEESSLVENSAWLFTKQRVIGKVYGLFGLLSQNFSEMISGYAHSLPEEVTRVSPKIYKGEMYRQLPYVMLDNPRYFNQQDVFAIRSFFWWGHEFSVHLVLGGKFREQFAETIDAQIEAGLLDAWNIGGGDNPWEHHFEADNYMPIRSWRSQSIRQLPAEYIKLGKRLPLSQWQDAAGFFNSSYAELLDTLFDPKD